MNRLETLDFLNPRTFITYTLIFFVIVFVRYLLISGAYHYVFFVLFKKKYQERILNLEEFQRQQLKREVGWSAISALIFALIFVGSIMLWQLDLTAIYLDLHIYPIWYIPISIVLVLFLHDTYYYWIHRWMHKPKILRYFHAVHHDSIHTSALTSFSFHPFESFLQAIIIPAILLLLPVHIYGVLIILTIMTISATVNHAGVEVYPKSWSKYWLTKWLIGATHHDLHHKQFRYNFGLYFTFWDKVMGTESPAYQKSYAKKGEE